MKIYCDGGAKPNPGDGGIGFIALKDDKIVLEGYQYMGENLTNNQCEFIAAINSLTHASLVFGAKQVELYVDSELVYCSVLPVLHPKHKNIRSKKLKPLHKTLLSVMELFEKIDVFHISRNENTIADKLCYHAINTKTSRITQIEPTDS